MTTPLSTVEGGYDALQRRDRSAPKEPDVGLGGRLKHAGQVVGGSLGRLVFLLVAAILLVGVLAIFFDNPTFWIAFAALVVAVGAYKASKRR